MKFDIRWGYNAVQVKKGHEWKAAFTTNEGLYEPTVMFFGLTNSPATFQVLAILKQNNLYLNIDKCEFEQLHIDFLGVHIENNQLKMEDAKIKKVRDWTLP